MSNTSDKAQPQGPQTEHRGDDGHSDLLFGERPPKDAPVFEALGWLDELNAAIGHLRAVMTPAHTTGNPPDTRSPGALLGGDLRAVQLVLGRIMGMVASDPAAPIAGPVTDKEVAILEELERRLRAQISIKPRFYVPGDTTEASALADVARARCRTAERALVRMPAPGTGLGLVAAGRYLNRLSDVLFATARFLDDLR